ncbi:MLP1_3 [Sanghuangporus sanghuang]
MFTPNIILMGHESGKVTLFDVKMGEEALKHTWTLSSTCSSRPTARTSSPAAKTRPLVYMIRGKFETRFWHKIFEEELRRVKGHLGPINTLAMYPSGKCYASGGEDELVRVHHFDESYLNAKPYEGNGTNNSSANTQIERLRNECSNLRAEKKIWEDVQTRLIDENKVLSLERSRMADLIANVQKMHNDIDKANGNDRRRFGNFETRIHDLESQAQDLRTQLSREPDTVRQISL